MSRKPPSRIRRRANDTGNPVELATANRHRFGRVGLPVVALTGLALLLAACSGGGSTTSSTAATTTTTTTAASTSTSTLPASSTSPSTSTTTTVGSGTTTTTPTDALAQGDKYTACMRAHGVSDFPEPSVVNGQIIFAGPPGLGRTPAFPSAQQTCGQSVYGSAPVQGGGNG
jgi:hypothetical protein